MSYAIALCWYSRRLGPTPFMDAGTRAVWFANAYGAT